MIGQESGEHLINNQTNQTDYYRDICNYYKQRNIYMQDILKLENYVNEYFLNLKKNCETLTLFSPQKLQRNTHYQQQDDNIVKQSNERVCENHKECEFNKKNKCNYQGQQQQNRRKHSINNNYKETFYTDEDEAPGFSSDQNLLNQQYFNIDSYRPNVNQNENLKYEQFQEDDQEQEQEKTNQNQKSKTHTNQLQNQETLENEFSHKSPFNHRKMQQNKRYQLYNNNVQQENFDSDSQKEAYDDNDDQIKKQESEQEFENSDYNSVVINYDNLEQEQDLEIQEDIVQCNNSDELLNTKELRLSLEKIINQQKSHQQDNEISNDQLEYRNSAQKSDHIQYSLKSERLSSKNKNFTNVHNLQFEEFDFDLHLKRKMWSQSVQECFDNSILYQEDMKKRKQECQLKTNQSILKVSQLIYELEEIKKKYYLLTLIIFFIFFKQYF